MIKIFGNKNTNIQTNKQKEPKNKGAIIGLCTASFAQMPIQVASVFDLALLLHISEINAKDSTTLSKAAKKALKA